MELFLAIRTIKRLLPEATAVYDTLDVIKLFISFIWISDSGLSSVVEDSHDREFKRDRVV